MRYKSSSEDHGKQVPQHSALQTSGRLSSSHSTLPLNIWQPLHPCTPPPSPTASQHLPHTSLSLRSKSSRKLKSTMFWGWWPGVTCWVEVEQGLFLFFFLNFKWIHNSLGSMLSCLTGSHWEAHLIWKSVVNINFFRSFVSPWELEDTIKNIWGRKTMLCWWHASSKQRELILAGEKNEQNTSVLFVKYESKKMS